MKLGSLFDGSGGFPLAGTMCGIKPVWASEVEPYPIAVTKIRFPNMKHLGDISKINGAEIEPVDVITFGSPCQDLSVAGKRAGLKHEDNGDDETTRSGLFWEAVRIIKEMREATNGEYPRIVLWENVPGAFSSNKGEDFRIVLEELIKIVEPTAVMPEVPKGGWAYADSYCGDGWSLAYRLLDRGPLDVCPIISATFGMGGNNQPFVVEKETVALEGNGQRPSHNGDGYSVTDKSYTLNSTEVHAVAYETPPTYIVRRLTPTECARLQGFPDLWGHIDPKSDLTYEEYLFWLDTRNTHAEINGRATKIYTQSQMLTWYNKLHTDSAEYKMWGNGIALPCALYVMQGIAEVLYESRN